MYYLSDAKVWGFYRSIQQKNKCILKIVHCFCFFLNLKLNSVFFYIYNVKFFFNFYIKPQKSSYIDRMIVSHLVHKASALSNKKLLPFIGLPFQRKNFPQKTAPPIFCAQTPPCLQNHVARQSTEYAPNHSLPTRSSTRKCADV